MCPTYIVALPCPRCAAERTMRRSDGRTLCLNCLLRRRGAETSSVAEVSAQADRPEHPLGSAA